MKIFNLFLPGPVMIADKIFRRQEKGRLERIVLIDL
jgi:hypothetical protein